MTKHALYTLAIILSLLLLLFSCSRAKYKYPSIQSISMEDGLPMDSIAPNFILDSIKFHDNGDVRIWNGQNKQIINKILAFASEPLLYNYFLKRDIYRFVIGYENRKFLIVSISVKDDAYWLITKKITVDNEEGYTLVFRSYDLTKEQFGHFIEKWDEAMPFILKDSKQDKSVESFVFVEMHTKDDYCYFFEQLQNSEINKLMEWVMNNSRLKL